MRANIHKLKDFTKEALIDKIHTFHAEQNGLSVKTEVSGRQIRNVEVSEQYRFFDFKDYALQLVEDIDEETFAKYRTLFARGIQELALYSQPFLINGDVYYKSLYILNSTDKSRALQFVAGLFREKTYSALVPVIDESARVRVIHRGDKFTEKASGFKEFTESFDRITWKQIDILRELSYRKVSLKSFINVILNERLRNGQFTTTALNRAKAIIHRMLNSQTDKIERKFDTNELDLLSRVIDFTKNTSFDVEVSAYQLYMWYVEVYRNRDISVIKHESDRFFKLLNVA